MWRRFTVPLLVVVLAVALIMVAQLRDGTEGSDTPPSVQGAPSVQDGPVARAIEPEQQPAVELERRDPADPLAAGPVDAPVVLIAYSDYQCPFCALWAEQTEPVMMELVAAGDLRIEWREFPYLGDLARDLSAGALAVAELKGGLDVQRFTTDLRSVEVADQVQRNEDEGLGIGAYSTPMFLIGGQPVVGAQPTEVFVQAVQDARARADR